MYGKDCRNLELGSPSEGEISGALITISLTRATNIINSYLERPYPELVPFAAGDVPAMIDDIATAIATYFVKRARFPGPGPLAEQTKADYYDKSIEDLKAISKGELKLPELTSKIKRDIKSTQSGYAPIFGVSDTENSVVSPTRLDDEADDRNE